MDNMELRLPLDFKEFLSLLNAKKVEFNQLKLKRLRQEVSIGLEEIKRGEVVEFDLEDILNADVK